MNNKFFLLILIQFLTIDFSYQDEKRFISVKIIEEPVQYMSNPYSSSRRFRNEDETELKPKYKPADFSGPLFLNELNGQCFEYLNSNYKWNVCPFQNVTQFEQNLRWEPFKGIIGIWYEWEIVDETFMSLKMLNGDTCGQHGSRQAKIFFICNQNESKTQVYEIKEPSTCNYEIFLKTHLVCEKNYDTFTMNVYAYLNQSLKNEWDHVYTNYRTKLITEKLYNMSLSKIYQEAGFNRRPDDLKLLEIPQNLTSLNVTIKKADKMTFDELKQKYEECQKENERLKAVVKIQQKTTSLVNVN